MCLYANEESFATSSKRTSPTPRNLSKKAGTSARIDGYSPILQASASKTAQMLNDKFSTLALS